MYEYKYNVTKKEGKDIVEMLKGLDLSVYIHEDFYITETGRYTETYHECTIIIRLAGETTKTLLKLIMKDYKDKLIEYNIW